MATRYPSDYRARGPEPAPWTSTAPRTDPCADPCPPACPACGGLKCLCRPRFFPGQLLTDEDLNRLEQYVIDKNRLHNRYLQGWGVACGLEVVCDGCDSGHVVVRDGYALSPCGDDIIVCNDQSVDICALINSCEPRQPVCDNPFDTPPRDCTAGNRKWVIAICYDEKPVRGITAQLGAGDTTASARCGCGGSSSSCGCGGSTGAGCGCGTCASGADCSCGTAAKPAPTRGKYKPQCEPTQICEGYRFVAYPAAKDVKVDPGGIREGGSDFMWAWLYANRARFGPLIERLLCCVMRAMDLRQTIREGKTINRDFALSAYQEYAAALMEFAQDFAIHNCSFVQRTRQQFDIATSFDWDGMRNKATRGRVLAQNVDQLDTIWTELIAECMCSALLPGCPAPARTNCVPLATVTITGNECRVVEICNWSERKILISWPTITYWLSWLPWYRVHAWLAKICCGPERGNSALTLMALLIGLVTSSLANKQGTDDQRVAMARRAAGAAETDAPPFGTSKDAFEASNLITHLLRNFQTMKTEDAAATGAPGWAALVARMADASPMNASIVPDPALAALTARLDAAEARLMKQDEVIAGLRREG